VLARHVRNPPARRRALPAGVRRPEHLTRGPGLLRRTPGPRRHPPPGPPGARQPPRRHPPRLPPTPHDLRRDHRLGLAHPLQTRRGLTY
jgi:hypothetical protein